MFAGILANTRFLVDKSEIWDHFEDESIMARKNWKGPLGGPIGPHTSTFSCSRNFGIVCIVFEIVGWVINFPWEHARHSQGGGSDISRYAHHVLNDTVVHTQSWVA